MANHVIKISGDFKDLKRGFTGVVNELKPLLSQKLGFKLDKETRDFLGRAGKEAVRGLTSELEGAKREFADLAKNANKSADAFDKFVKGKEKILSLSRALKQANEGMGVVGGGGRGGQGGGGVFKALSQMGSGVGGNLMSALGLGGMGMRGLAAAGGGAAMMALPLAFMGMGVSRRLKQGDARLRLMGMGAKSGEIDQDQVTGSQMGYNPEESLDQSIKLRRATGQSGFMHNVLLGSVQKNARQYGLDTEQLTGMAGSLRQASGKNMVNAEFENVMRDAMVSGIEDSRMGEYLEVIASNTESMASRGIFGADAFSKAMSSLQQQGGIFDTPGRNAQYLTGLQNSIQGSQGPAKHFFYRAARETLGNKAKAGDLDFMVRQGIFGVGQGGMRGMQNLTPEQQKYFADSGMAGAGTSQQWGGNIKKQFFQKFGGLDVSRQAGLAQDLLHTQTPMEGLALMNQLDKLDPETMEKIQKASMSQDDKMTDIMGNVDMIAKIMKAKWGYLVSGTGNTLVSSVGSNKGLSTGSYEDVEAKKLWDKNNPGVPYPMETTSGKTLGNLPKSEADRIKKYAPTINSVSEMFGGIISPEEIAGTTKGESSFNPGAVSETNVHGLMQMTQGTWNKTTLPWLKENYPEIAAGMPASRNDFTEEQQFIAGTAEMTRLRLKLQSEGKDSSLNSVMGGYLAPKDFRAGKGNVYQQYADQIGASGALSGAASITDASITAATSAINRSTKSKKMPAPTNVGDDITSKGLLETLFPSLSGEGDSKKSTSLLQQSASSLRGILRETRKTNRNKGRASSDIGYA